MSLLTFVDLVLKGVIYIFTLIWMHKNDKELSFFFEGELEKRK